MLFSYKDVCNIISPTFCDKTNHISKFSIFITVICSKKDYVILIYLQLIEDIRIVLIILMLMCFFLEPFAFTDKYVVLHSTILKYIKQKSNNSRNKTVSELLV